MPANFEGNIGNEGNEGNAGNSGNASSASGGWFFADRVDLPFVTELDANDQPIAGNRINIGKFPLRNWAADWYAWLVVNEFASAVNWRNINILPGWAGNPPDWSLAQPVIKGELNSLVTMAQDERADALGEILGQSDEFISYFMNLMTTRPTAYPATFRVLNIASLVALFVSMYYKGLYQRPRPSQLCPALLPPIVVPGHASFPSGHSTQAHLMVLCMGQEVLQGFPQYNPMADDLATLADRIARNREIAGLHYPSDSQAGTDLAAAILPLLHNLPAASFYQRAITDAQNEWNPANQ
jgi:membrane-associated phospholipid phosphatase